MTRAQYIEAAATSHTPFPIALLDGRMGLCTHHTETAILVDAYRGNECEQISVPFDRVVNLGGGALAEREAR